MKRKKEISAACSMLLLFDYAWVISLFCNGFNDWIIDVTLNRIRVRHSAIFRLLTILEEEVLRICTVQRLSTTSSWYSFVSFSLFVTFFHQDYYNFWFSDKRHTVAVYAVLTTFLYCNQCCLSRIYFWV